MGSTSWLVRERDFFWAGYRAKKMGKMFFFLREEDTIWGGYQLLEKNQGE